MVVNKRKIVSFHEIFYVFETFSAPSWAYCDAVLCDIIMYVCRTEYYMFKSFPLQSYSYSKYQLYDDRLDLNSKMIFFQILTKNWTMVSFFESNQDKIRPLCTLQQHSWCWYSAVVLNEVFMSWSKAIQSFFFSFLIWFFESWFYEK